MRARDLPKVKKPKKVVPNCHLCSWRSEIKYKDIQGIFTYCLAQAGKFCHVVYNNKQCKDLYEESTFTGCLG